MFLKDPTRYLVYHIDYQALQPELAIAYAKKVFFDELKKWLSKDPSWLSFKCGKDQRFADLSFTLCEDEYKQMIDCSAWIMHKLQYESSKTIERVTKDVLIYQGITSCAHLNSDEKRKFHELFPKVGCIIAAGSDRKVERSDNKKMTANNTNHEDEASASQGNRDSNARKRRKLSSTSSSVSNTKLRELRFILRQFSKIVEIGNIFDVNSTLWLCVQKKITNLNERKLVHFGGCNLEVFKVQILNMVNAMYCNAFELVPDSECPKPKSIFLQLTQKLRPFEGCNYTYPPGSQFELKDSISCRWLSILK